MNNNPFRFKLMGLLALGLIGLSGCNDDEVPQPTNEEELITTVEFTLNPISIGVAKTSEPIVITYTDLDGPGGDDPVITGELNLLANTTYSTSIMFLNEQESPAEDITEEVAEEADEHQVFYAVDPANDSDLFGDNDLEITFIASDSDSRGCDLGLEGTLTTTGSGTGVLRIILRHQPGETGKASVNCGTTPSGNRNLGSSDVQIDFDITVSNPAL